MNTIQIMGEVDYVDLRKVTYQKAFLESVKKRYKLKHLQAVLFVNTRRTRFRLVVNIDGMPFLDLPPIDEKGKHSMFLKVSEWLSLRAKLATTRIEINHLSKVASERIKRQEKIKKNKETSILRMKNIIKTEAAPKARKTKLRKAKR